MSELMRQYIAGLVDEYAGTGGRLLPNHQFLQAHRAGRLGSGERHLGCG